MASKKDVNPAELLRSMLSQKHERQLVRLALPPGVDEDINPVDGNEGPKQTHYKTAIDDTVYVNAPTFYFFGDSGTPNEALKSMVDALKSDIDKTSAAQCISLLGDNFYPRGTLTADDIQFKEAFQDVYPVESFPLPFYAILGNHDYYGNVDFQIAYTKRDPTSRWRMPAKWFHVIHNLKVPKPGKKDEFDDIKVLIMYLDTFSLDLDETESMLAYAVWAGKYMTIEDAEKLLTKLKGERKEQMAWIHNVLEEAAKSKFDFKIVCGHYQMYSKGMHGTSEALISTLADIFAMYKVNVYLNGHDHTMQLTRMNNVIYCTCGSASNEEEMKPEYKPEHFIAGNPGFAKLEFTTSEVRLSLISSNREILAQESTLIE